MLRSGAAIRLPGGPVAGPAAATSAQQPGQAPQLAFGIAGMAGAQGGLERGRDLPQAADPAEVVDSDDVVAMEQPHLLHFVHEHVDAALEAHADEVDVDDVHAIYRVVLVEILALSYAVKPPKNVDHAGTSEFTA